METFQNYLKRRGINAAALARHLGITRAAVSEWRQVPKRRAREVQAFVRMTDAELVLYMAEGGEE